MHFLGVYYKKFSNFDHRLYIDIDIDGNFHTQSDITYKIYIKHSARYHQVSESSFTGMADRVNIKFRMKTEHQRHLFYIGAYSLW